jgi:hypothetical protein
MNTIDPLLKGLDKYLEFVETRAATGLRAAAHDVTVQLKSTTAHGDVTGATRAGYVAYVVGADLLSQGQALQALNMSVAAVAARNPGESAVAPGVIGGESIGMILTSPTTYQQNLETDNAGQRAVLGPTLQAVADDLTRRAIEGR